MPSDLWCKRSASIWLLEPCALQFVTLKAPDDADTRKGKRIDLEWIVGSHTIRAGYDAQDFISSRGETYLAAFITVTSAMPAKPHPSMV